jgi:hypothetical protein
VIAQVTGSGQYASFFDSPVVTVVLETNTATVHVEWYDCRSPVAARLTIDLPNNGGQVKIDYAIAAPSSPICDSREPGFLAAYLGRGPFTPS